METANCLDCGSEIILKKPPQTGQLVTCNHCGTELQVVWLDPLELDWPYMDDYDEDDEEYDYDDDDDDDY